jgi:hypothetical protein
MEKKTSVLIFVVAVSIGSFLLATYVEAAKTSDFLSNQQQRIEDDKHRLVLATAIANGHGDYDAFVFEEALLNLQINEDDIQLDINVYRLVYVKNNLYTFNLAMLMTDVNIEPSMGLLIDNEHQLKIDIVFNQSITVNNANQNEFIETPISLYSDKEKLAIFEVNALIHNYPSLLITSIQIGYVNVNNAINYAYRLTEQQLNAIQFNEIILDDLPNDVLFREDVVYDPSLLISLRQFNWYYVSHFSVYFGFVITIGYLIFLKPKKLKQ